MAHDEIACEHGRIEERKVEVLSAQVLKGLVDLSAWDSLCSLVKMTCTSEVKGTRQKTVEERFYISSLTPQDPHKILHAIRVHWGIESMHWSLDVSFHEDACRIRHETSALNLSWMRKMALSLLKAEKSFKASIRRKQLKLWSSPQYAFKVFSAI